MGKRSSFARREKDFYPTPKQAVLPLLPFLPPEASTPYCEPCAGAGDLIAHLPFVCVSAFDIEPKSPAVEKRDALTLTDDDVRGCDLIITNPPWSRELLHPMIERFSNLRPTWLLFDADWKHTKQAAELLKRCSDVVSIGRIKWIPGSKHTGKDNCCWYRFQKYQTETRFHGRQ